MGEARRPIAIQIDPSPKIPHNSAGRPPGPSPEDRWISHQVWPGRLLLDVPAEKPRHELLGDGRGGEYDNIRHNELLYLI
jgi:hypothetical protein